MSLFVMLIPLLAQVGPNPAAKPQDLPRELIERPMQDAAKPDAQTLQPAQTPSPVQTGEPGLAECLADVRSDPVAALARAEAWSAGATGSVRAEALQCRGMASSQLGGVEDARTDFVAALAAAPADDYGFRARVGALAGNSALAAGDNAGALELLDVAATAAAAAGEGAPPDDSTLAGLIAIDRARALVALGRNDEAASALDAARRDAPGSAQAWLLSATLSRRMNRLDVAQRQIEQAAQLLPVDPEIGLEAGVIAMLLGREDAAAKSWRSVIVAAPQSLSAQTAQGYLAQIGQGTNIIGR